MPTFRDGTHINADYAKGRSDSPYRRLRISAGPQRGQYVDTLILQAKLGRPLRDGYTVEHVDGDSLNVDPANLIEVTRPENSTRMQDRRQRRRDYAPAPGAIA